MLHELLTDPRPTEFRPRFDLNNPALPPPPPRLGNARVPAALSDLVENILSRDPTRRPVDTEALRRELADLQAERSAEYDVPAHAPSAQLPSKPQSLKRHVALFARPRGRSRWRGVLAGIVTLVVGALLWRYSAAVISGPPAEPRVDAGPRPPITHQSAPSGTAPPAMSPPGSSPMAPPAPAIAAVPKEGSTVKTPAPEVPTPGRTRRVLKKSVAAAECASLSLVAALAAGCPGAQLRPEAFTCPAGAEEAMWEHLHWEEGERFSLLLDDRYGVSDQLWFTAGAEVVGVVPKVEDDKRQAAVAPPGTRFYGKAYYLSDKMGRADGPALVVRYDRVKLPGQDEQPICFVVEGTVYDFKDGKVYATNYLSGKVVDRWP